MAAKTENLCAYCTAFFPIINTENSSRTFHSTWEELEDQIQTCLLCSFIQNALANIDLIQSYRANADPSKKCALLNVNVIDPHSCPNSIRWTILNITIQFPDISYTLSQLFSITTREKTATIRDSFWAAPTVPKEDKISLCKEWFQNCESSHGTDCNPAVGTLPLRLIDVGSENLAPRLVLGSDISSSDTKYATLSHCWGRELPIRTTRANLQLYSQEIPSNSIPRTFYEALSIVRVLSISYLWIDALCIVQDSPEEWEAEASKMKDVYSSSSLNIAASDARGSAEGCFPDSDGTCLEQSQFVISVNNETELVVKIQVGDTRRATDDTVLNTRGWILQEQLLSHRMVSCMRSELHWQCTDAYKIESGVEFERDSAIKGIPRLRSGLGTADEHVWRIWMQDFSQRQFTFWEDRLPSLAGITEHYQKVTNDTPALGLWRSSLIGDLLWIRLTDSPPRSSTQSDPLPSWTWLSCTGFIKFGYWGFTQSETQMRITIREHSTLIDVGVVWSRAPMTSALQSAHLALEGPLIDISIAAVTTGRISNPPYLLVGNVTIEDGPDPNSAIPWVAAGQFDDTNHVSASSYMCLLIQSVDRGEDSSHKETFLILERVQSGLNSSYKRIGIGCFFGKCVEFGTAKRERVHLI